MSDDFNVRVDIQPVIDWLENTAPKQIAFAVSQGLNKTALAIQEHIRLHIIDKFKLRRKNWVLNRIYISPTNRATKTRWSVTIEVQEPRDILNKFEAGGQVFPHEGHAHIAIPNAKVFRSIIAADDPLTIKNLQLRETTPNHIQGLEETYLIKSKATGVPLIVQDVARKTKGKRARGQNKFLQSRILYTLVKKETLPAKLEFISTAVATVNRQMDSIISDAVQLALRTGR